MEANGFEYEQLISKLMDAFRVNTYLSADEYCRICSDAGFYDCDMKYGHEARERLQAEAQGPSVVKTDLSEVPTSELVEEIQRRSMSMVLCWAHHDGGNDTPMLVRSCVTGSEFFALGMVEAAREKLKRSIMNGATPGSGID